MENPIVGKRAVTPGMGSGAGLQEVMGQGIGWSAQRMLNVTQMRRVGRDLAARHVGAAVKCVKWSIF